MTNESLTKIVDAIFEKYERAEAIQLTIELLQDRTVPYIPISTPQITPLPYEPSVTQKLIWNWRDTWVCTSKASDFKDVVIQALNNSKLDDDNNLTYAMPPRERHK